MRFEVFTDMMCNMKKEAVGSSEIPARLHVITQNTTIFDNLSRENLRTYNGVLLSYVVMLLQHCI
jgi:hypothetical protein